MVYIEPLLVDLCIQINRMNESIDQETYFNLTNNLIKSTPTEQQNIDFKKIMCGIDSYEANLGKNYYWNFMKRHENKIYRRKTCRE
jgi:hypothetical protein